LISRNPSKTLLSLLLSPLKLTDYEICIKSLAWKYRRSCEKHFLLLFSGKKIFFWGKWSSIVGVFWARRFLPFSNLQGVQFWGDVILSSSLDYIYLYMFITKHIYICLYIYIE
jgi:hypothetical protein